LSTTDVVASYKSLAHVERAFRSLKTVEIELRPIHHRKPDRVRAHVFLCMLAYYVEWHMRRALAPILFQDDDRPAAAKARKSIVAPAKRSPRAEAKAASKLTDDGFRVASFRSCLTGLATITRNEIAARGLPSFTKISKPTAAQSRAIELLDIRL